MSEMIDLSPLFCAIARGDCPVTRHQEKMFMKSIHQYPTFIKSNLGLQVYIPIFHIFVPKHTLWVLC